MTLKEANKYHSVSLEFWVQTHKKDKYACKAAEYMLDPVTGKPFLLYVVPYKGPKQSFEIESVVLAVV